MQKIIGVTDLQRRFKAILDEVSEDRVPYVLTRGSRPEAALIPYDEYQRLVALQEKEVLIDFDRLLRRRWEASEDLPEDEVAAEVRSAREEVRKG